MKNLASIFFICLSVLCISCTSKKNSIDKGRLVRINLTDTCIKSILSNYIKTYSFEGKGIYLVNLKNYNDSIKYYVGIAFTEEQVKLILKNAPYYFYEIYNDRAVIIDTKLEWFIKPQNCVFDSDTILQKYYSSDLKSREVYFMEFTKIGNTISSKVIYFDPF